MVRTVVCLVMAWVSLSARPAQPRAGEPFLPAGVWYGGGAVRPPAIAAATPGNDSWHRDLALIKSLGFNSVTTWVDWSANEPERGRYEFSALKQVLASASALGLDVIVHFYTDTAPAWVGGRYADARFVGDPSNSSGAAVRFCADHPGVRDDRLAFIGAAARAAASERSFRAVDLRIDAEAAASRNAPVPGGAMCRCVHTKARYDAWASLSPGLVRAVPAFETFRRSTLLSDLAAAAAAARTQGAPLVAADVRNLGRAALSEAKLDHASVTLPPGFAGEGSPVHVMAELDALALAGGRPWWLRSLPAAVDAVTASEVRLWSWAAYSRGARGIAYSDWPGLEPMPGAAIGARTRAAGEAAGNLSRNVRLFDPMRPHPSKVAIVFESRDAAGAASRSGASGVPDAALAWYRLLFDWNIQADIIDAGQFLGRGSATYRVVLAGSAPLTRLLAAALEVFALSGGVVVREDAAALGANPKPALERLAAAGVQPEIRIEGASGPVEARILESADAWLILAINHADTPQAVTMTFSPDLPEAIWQNMESGAAVQFVQGAAGPVYRHRFAARDVMLLVRGKRLR